MTDKSSLQKKLESLLKAEKGLITPDFILAEYLQDCLTLFDRTVRAREDWHRRFHAAEAAGVPVPTRMLLAAADLDPTGAVLVTRGKTKKLRRRFVSKHSAAELKKMAKKKR